MLQEKNKNEAVLTTIVDKYGVEYIGYDGASVPSLAYMAHIKTTLYNAFRVGINQTTGEPHLFPLTIGAPEEALVVTIFNDDIRIKTPVSNQSLITMHRDYIGTHDSPNSTYAIFPHVEGWEENKNT